MSFFDPILDVFGDLDDTVNEEIPGGWATVAAVTAAAMTGGTSLGATGGVDAAAMGSWDVLPAVGEGVAAITPQTIGAAGALAPYETIGSGIMGANATPVVSGAAPMVAQPIAPLPPAGPTVQAMGGSAAAPAGAAPPPVTTSIPTGEPALTAKGSLTYNSLNQPVYTSGTIPAAPPAQSIYSIAPPAAPAGATAPSLEGLKASSSMMTPQPSGFAQGVDAFSRFATAHPFITAGGAYLGAKGLGLLDQEDAPAQEKYNGVLTRYKMSPDFQASNAQPNVYKPTYAAAGGIMQAGGPVEQMSMNAIGDNQGYPQSGLPYSGYSSPTASPIPQNVVQSDAGDVGVNPQTGQEAFAQGGIAHFRKGGNLSDAMDFYKSMTTSQAQAPSGKGDPGIYYDMDPDTRYQDALTAAQIRQAKVNKRAYVTPPVAKRPTPMGQLNLRPPGAKADAAGSSLDPEMAAQGGIMHSSLGGYAAGGNPRLLKGPGDGMSDNIPATIAGKQPARLADGEFVIPADVVSHLGNGSTEAGAKRLHEMMNKIRKARTGNSKQGKQINPNKFMPA